MSLSLEDDHFMDDLFGDGGHVAIPPPVVSVKGLSQTLDHLASSSACQRVAWSKNGTVAAISPDGKSVRLYVLIKGSKSNSWTLSKPSILPLESDDEHHLVHVSWNQMGGMLSIFDSCGRINIFDTINNTSGRMTLSRSGSKDGGIEMDAIAASYWFPVLPYADKRPFAHSASLQNSNWRFAITGSSLTPPGPHNILSTQSALLVLTKRSQLRILYQQADGQFDEDKALLDTHVMAMENFITHGAFAPHTDNSVLLATFDNSKCLRVFQIMVNFRKEPFKSEVPDQDEGSRVKVSFEIKNLTMLTNLAPTPADPFGNDGTTAAGVPIEQYALTHLDLLSMVNQDNSRPGNPPTIFAVFSLISPMYHGTSSIVCRWHLNDGPESVLLPVWNELSIMKRKTSDLPTRKDYNLERVQDMTLPSIVLSVSIVRQYTMMAFTMSDGSVQFRFRESLDLASADGSYEEVQSLPQAGFSFPMDEPALYAALSPSACCAVAMNADGDVKLRKMAYTVGDVSQVKEDDAHFGAFAAIFALYWMTAWLNYTSVDDLLAIFPTYMSQALPSAAIIQSCVAIGPLSTFDFVILNQQNVTKLFSSGLVDKILGAYCGLFSQRGSKVVAQAKLSWMALNLRLMNNNMAGYNTTTTAGKQGPADIKPDFQLVLGMIRWMQDAQTFVIQELMDMAYELGDKCTDKAAIERWIKKHHSCGMHLMLCSLTRFLFRNALRTLKKSYDIAELVFRAKPKDPSSAMYWTAYYKQFHNCPLAAVMYKDDPAEKQQNQQNQQQNKPPVLKPLEQFIVDIDTAVKKCYGQLDERRRGVIERDMFLLCEIPDVLVPAAAFLLKRVLDFRTTPGVSEYAIWGHDVAWLGITGEGGQGLNCGDTVGKDGMRVDVIRKIHLAQSKSVRSCPRCGSVAEEFADTQQNGFPNWLTKSTRTCVCSDNWCVQEEDMGDGPKNGV